MYRGSSLRTGNCRMLCLRDRDDTSLPHISEHAFHSSLHVPTWRQLWLHGTHAVATLLAWQTLVLHFDCHHQFGGAIPGHGTF